MNLEPIYPIMGIFFVIVLLVLYILHKQRQQEVEKLLWYAKRIKNIYEVTEYPGDLEVLKRSREHIDWLIKSGNKLRGKVKSVKVYAIIWQDLDVTCFHLEESPNDGKVIVVKRKMYTDRVGVNATEPFEQSENPEEHTFYKRKQDTIKMLDQKRAVEVRFSITDKDIEESESENEKFWETNWLKQE